VNRDVSRRTVLGLGLAAAFAPLVAACGSSSDGGNGGGSELKFWDMPWGGDAYLAAEKSLVAEYAPSGGLPRVSFQQIQWENFYQTFASAVVARTGPAVSSGGGFQAFQFADQGAIAYADEVVAELKKNGMYDDFLPGYVESFKTAKGYVAIPWSIDMRVFWYRKSLLDRAGVDVPTDWDSLRAAGLALKKIGVYGFGTGAGAGNAIGNQSIMSMIINNGGGLFDPDGKPNCVTDENVQAVDFIVGLAKDGIVDPSSVSYTTANMQAQWKNKKFGIGIYTPGLRTDTGDTSDDLQVPSPLTSPTGKKGTIVYIPNLMMYTNTPSQKGSEAFLIWYLQHMKAYWTKEVMPLLPVLKSIVATPEFQKNTMGVKITNEWAPIAKTLAAQSTAQFSALAAVDGGSAINLFAQTVLAGKTPAKTALQNLEKGIGEVVK
jgi:multiple sugar transport system substrate-binding protein